MLQVIQVVNQIFTSNTYLVFDDAYDYCWLIDIGDFEKVANAIASGVEVRGVFLTHAHFDHIYGINALHKAFPNCRVYTTEYGRVAIYDEKKNFSKYHEAPFVYEGTDVAVLQDNEKKLYPELFITAIATPGHCPSCQTYILNDWIFTGDSYIPNVMVVTKLPNGNRLLAKQSINKILQMAQGKIICPGHGDKIKN